MVKYAVQMSSLNRVTLIGNLTRDPDLQTISSGAQVCDIGLALNRTWSDTDGRKQEEVTFVEISFWGKNGENAAKYLSKGSAVYIEGRLQLSTWKDKETGKDRSRLRIVGERIQFLGSPSPERHEAA